MARVDLELPVEPTPERFGIEPDEDQGARFAQTPVHCVIMPRG